MIFSCGYLLRSVIFGFSWPFWPCFPFSVRFMTLFNQKGSIFLYFCFLFFTFCTTRRKVQPLCDFCCAFWFCWSTCLFFLPYFWMDGCYYFLNLIFLMFIFRHWFCCLSFMPLFEKRPYLSASSSSHGFVQPKRFDVSVGDCCVRLCCIVSNICIFLCAFLVWRLFVYAFWFCWSKF